MSPASRIIAVVGTALGLLGAGAPSAAAAVEKSSCVTCHLDEKLLVKNLAVSKVVKSALQSGAG